MRYSLPGFSEALHDVGHVAVLAVRHPVQHVHHFVVGAVALRVLDEVLFARRKVDATQVARDVDRRISGLTS